MKYKAYPVLSCLSFLKPAKGLSSPDSKIFLIEALAGKTNLRYSKKIEDKFCSENLIFKLRYGFSTYRTTACKKDG